MSETGRWLLEIRLFKLHSGVRAEFDRISREGTIPLMRKQGINVVAHGAALNDDDCYYLLRAFRSQEERIELSQAVYATEEWEQNYEDRVMGMIADYYTAVIPASDRSIRDLAADLVAHL